MIIPNIWKKKRSKPPISNMFCFNHMMLFHITKQYDTNITMLQLVSVKSIGKTQAGSQHILPSDFMSSTFHIPWASSPSQKNVICTSSSSNAKSPPTTNRKKKNIKKSNPTPGKTKSKTFWFSLIFWCLQRSELDLDDLAIWRCRSLTPSLNLASELTTTGLTVKSVEWWAETLLNISRFPTSYGGTPNYHPLNYRMFHEIKHAPIGVPGVPLL